MILVPVVERVSKNLPVKINLRVWVGDKFELDFTNFRAREMPLLIFRLCFVWAVAYCFGITSTCFLVSQEPVYHLC
jgi:hypothetical protein